MPSQTTSTSAEHPSTPPAQGPKITAQRHPIRHSSVLKPPSPSHNSRLIVPAQTTIPSSRIINIQTSSAQPKPGGLYAPAPLARRAPASPTASAASTPKRPFTPRSPLLLTILVASLTVTGTLYGASLKQSHDATRQGQEKEQAQVEQEEASGSPDLVSSTFGTQDGARTVATTAKVEQAAEVERRRIQEAKMKQMQIQRLEETRARLLITRRGLEGKIEVLRERMAKEKEEKEEKFTNAATISESGSGAAPG